MCPPKSNVWSKTLLEVNSRFCFAVKEPVITEKHQLTMSLRHCSDWIMCFRMNNAMISWGLKGLTFKAGTPNPICKGSLLLVVLFLWIFIFRSFRSDCLFVDKIKDPGLKNITYNQMQSLQFSQQNYSKGRTYSKCGSEAESKDRSLRCLGNLKQAIHTEKSITFFKHISRTH